MTKTIKERSRGRTLILCAVVALSLDMLAGAASGKEAEVIPAWTAASLRLPTKDAPWKFAREIDGTYMILDIPGDLGSLGRLPVPLQTEVRRYIRFREMNIETLSGLASNTEKVLKRERFHRIPQYERTLRTAVISIEPQNNRAGDPVYPYEPIIGQLPPYSRLDVFAPKPLVPMVRQRLRALRPKGETLVHAVPEWEERNDKVEPPPYPSAWTQDLFRVAVNQAGAQVLFAPACYVQSDDLCRWDIDYLGALSTPDRSRTVVRLPIFFRAGNLLMGEASEPVLFIGRNALRFNSRNYFNALHMQPPDDAVIDLLKATSGVSQAEVLPNSRNLFHLDMAMAVLEKGVAALIEPLDRGSVSLEDRQVLKEIKRILAERGFRIIPVPTLAKRIKASQSPVNVVVYVDQRDGLRHIMLPEYPDAAVYVGGEKRSLNQMIRDAYRSAGLIVVPIEDRFHLGMGDIHCVFKVID